MSTNERRDKLAVLADEERRARNLFVACRGMGDLRNERQARRDLASLQRVRRGLRARPGVVVQAQQAADRRRAFDGRRCSVDTVSKLKTKVSTVERVCRELARKAPLRGVDANERLWHGWYRQALRDVVAEVRDEAASGR